MPEVDRLLDAYEASGAGVLVLSAVTGAEGYDTRAVLDDVRVSADHLRAVLRGTR